MPLILIAQVSQNTSNGKIEHIEKFPSKFVEPINVDIWIPDNYDGSRKFAVLYMQDGQMLFDSTTTWNHQSWNADNIANNLIKQNLVKDFIIVGIWNAGIKRHENYFPQKPFENLTNIEKDTVSKQLQRSGHIQDDFHPISDNYLKFLVFELKPFIDKKYSVNSDKDNTFIAGSSMGGLISIYAICEYPEIFGGAACLSTHWSGTFTLKNNPMPGAFLSYLKRNLPNPDNHKIYFDCGDQTLDILYPEIQKKVDEIMKVKGFNDTNWKTLYFKGADHSEKSWSKRFNIPIVFLLGK